MQAEVHVDDQLHCNRMALVHCGTEFVLPYCFNCPFVQTHSEMTNYVDRLRIALRIDDQLNTHDSLIVRLPRFRRELRFNGMDDPRSTHAAADIHQPTAITAIRSRSHACAVALAYAAARSYAKSCVASAAL